MDKEKLITETELFDLTSAGDRSFLD